MEASEVAKVQQVTLQTESYTSIFSRDANTLSVADDAIGVQKFTKSGSAWTLADNFTDPAAATANKAHGLAVGFSGINPIVHWTTPNSLQPYQRPPLAGSIRPGRLDLARAASLVDPAAGLVAGAVGVCATAGRRVGAGRG